MWDLKADDFTTSNSGGAATTQTLLVAAGQLPFVLADPTLSGPQAVLYPPSAADGTFAGNPVQALLMTSADGQTNYLLCYGRAVALGIIAATDSNGNSTNKHIAVVVGSGVVGSMTSCPVLSSAPAPYVSLLAVVDLTGAYAQGATAACDPKATTGSPNCPKAIGFVQLPTGGTDVKLNGNVALVATGTNVLLVNLENPSQPTLAGQISGTFGNWLALTDDGALVSSSSNSLSGAVQTALLSPSFIIQEVNPSTIDVDGNFRTIAPVHVKYAVADFGASNVSGAVEVTEDDKVVASVALPDMTPGVHSVDIPPGTPLNPSPEYAQLTVITNGQRTQTMVVRIDPSAPISETTQSTQDDSIDPTSGLPLSTPPIGLSPDHVSAGSGNAVIVLSLSSSVTQLWARRFDQNNWTVLTVDYSSSQPAVTVPGSLLGSPGLVQVSLTSDGFLGTSNLLVADPTLPAFGTSIDITTSGADASDDVITGASVTAYGSGFQTGSSVIVGRNGVPGFVLPSSVSASSLATATLTSALPGDDTSLVIGVAGPGLTAVSNSVPLYSALQEHLDAQEFSDSDLANEYSSTDVDLLRLVGNINLVPAEQTGPSAQNVKVYGVNIASGTVLEVKTQSGNLTITETVPLQNITTLGTGQPAPIASLLSHSLFSTELLGQTPVPSPASVGRGGAQLPSGPLKKRKHRVRGTAKGPNGQVIARTNAPIITASGQFGVPFGGRRHFQVYKNVDEKTLVIVPDQGAVPPKFVPVTSTDSVTATISTSNAQVERESNDDAGFYIRGIQLTQSQVRAGCTVGTDQPAFDVAITGPPGYSLKIPKKAIVQYATIGKGPIPQIPGVAVDRECALITVANTYRVPPNIFKAQIQQEGADFNAKYRYEPSTIDFQQISGEYIGNDGVFTLADERRISVYPWNLYALSGKYLFAYQNPDDRSKFATTIMPFATVPQDNKTFKLGSMIKAAQKIPFNDFPKDLQRQVAHPNVQAFYAPATTDAAKACIAAKLAPSACTVNAKQAGVVPLTLVWNQNLWTKFGHNTCQDSVALPAPSKKRKCVDPNRFPNGKPFSFSSTLGTNEFAVDYRNQNAIFGGLQGNGDVVVFTFERIGDSVKDAEPTPQNIIMLVSQPGSVVAGNPPNPAALGGGHTYNPGETIEQFFINNLGTNGSAAALTGTDSDRRIPFIADASNHPTVPVDPRYSFTTAQYYAAGTYGALQLTLGKWYGSPGSSFRNARDILKDPIWNLDLHWDQAVDLGGRVHAFALDPNNGINVTPCGIYDPQGIRRCNAQAWTKMWIPILSNYNGQGGAASEYAETILGVASHEFDPDFIACRVTDSHCPGKK